MNTCGCRIKQDGQISIPIRKQGSVNGDGQ